MRGWESLHANSFTKAKDGTGRFLMSLRTTSQVLIFNSDFKIIQVVGGHGKNNRTYQYVNPDVDRFLGQHAAYIEKDGTLLVYDNGGSHSEFDQPFRNFTRAMRLRLDPATMQASTVWEFDVTKFSGLVSRCCGSATMTDHGTVVTHTSHHNGSYPFYLFEADGTKSNQPLAIYTVNPGRVYEDMWWFRLIYRTHAEWHIDGEAVTCDLPSAVILPTLSEPVSLGAYMLFGILGLCFALTLCMLSVRRFQRTGLKYFFRFGNRRYNS